MWKDNPAAAGLLTLLDCPFDANTSKAFGGNCHRLICILCGVRIKSSYLYLLNVSWKRRCLHTYHTCLSKYRWVLVKCCTQEILCTHGLTKIRGNIGGSQSVNRCGWFFVKMNMHTPMCSHRQTNWKKLASTCSFLISFLRSASNFSFWFVLLEAWTYGKNACSNSVSTTKCENSINTNQCTSEKNVTTSTHLPVTTKPQIGLAHLMKLVFSTSAKCKLKPYLGRITHATSLDVNRKP